MCANNLTAASTLPARYHALIREAARAVLDGSDDAAERAYRRARVLAHQALQIGNRALLIDFAERWT